VSFILYQGVEIVGVWAMRLAYLGSLLVWMCLRWNNNDRATAQAGRTAGETSPGCQDLLDTMSQRCGVLVRGVLCAETLYDGRRGKMFAIIEKNGGGIAGWIPTGEGRGYLVLGGRYRNRPGELQGVLAHMLGHALHRPRLVWRLLKQGAGLGRVIATVFAVGSGFPSLCLVYIAARTLSDAAKAAAARQDEYAADLAGALIVGPEKIIENFDHLHETVGARGAMSRPGGGVFSHTPTMARRTARLRQREDIV